MDAGLGDTMKVETQRVGRAPRCGRVLESLGHLSVPHYRVRWNDGQESFYYPGPDGHIVEAAQPGGPAPLRVLHLRGSVRAAVPELPSRVGADDTLRAVAAALTTAEAGALLVFETERSIGMVSGQDVVRSLAAGADSDEVWAADLMVEETVCGSPDDSLLHAADVMCELGLRYLPLRQEGQLVGIVSSREILGAVLGSQRG
jgi:CBS domain-containing protein